ncbi:MAG: hypothetical protein ACFFDN_30245 [Candidatus Hodarchaeota archaeon]
MINSEITFNIGYNLGELSRQIAMVIETANQQCSKQLSIEVYRVYENLKYILDELISINASETITNDLKSYLNQLSRGKYDRDSESDETHELILEKLKRRFAERRQKGKLKPAAVKKLDLKLKIRKDRITRELNQLVNE